MRRLLPALFSVFFVLVALAETAHTHAQSCDDSCPSVCLGSACGISCGDSAAKSAAAPEAKESHVVTDPGCVFVARVSEDEIFHPPLVR